MADTTPSARHEELLELAYRYVLEHGLADVSLRPLAAAIGSSPRVLLYLFESKDGLVRALLGRARRDELEFLDGADGSGLPAVALEIWRWLAVEEHQALLTLWVEGYARSLVDPDGPWGDFAAATVTDWLEVLRRAQTPAARRSAAGLAQRTAVLALLRGAFLDLLATGDEPRITAAVRQHLRTLG
jgi:AcrR family transcriptional regulator